jgi:GNAT superfamily N-acetyltransferase
MIRPVSYSDILAHPELLAEYAAECSITEIGTVNPQGEIYAVLEKANIVRMFGAFHVEQLVGFASVLVSVLPHYGRKVATLESLFVSAPHRSGGKGAHLMAAGEEFARQSGCVAILYSAPAGGKLERLLTIQKKYRLTNSVFCRSLS